MTPPSKAGDVAAVFDSLARGDREEALDLLASSDFRVDVEIALLKALRDWVAPEVLAALARDSSA